MTFEIMLASERFPELPRAIELAQLAAALNPQLCALNPSKSLEDALQFLERAHLHAVKHRSQVQDYHGRIRMNLARASSDRGVANLHKPELMFVPSKVEDELRAYIASKQPSLDLKKGSSIRAC